MLERVADVPGLERVADVVGLPAPERVAEARVDGQSAAEHRQGAKRSRKHVSLGRLGKGGTARRGTGRARSGCAGMGAAEGKERKGRARRKKAEHRKMEDSFKGKGRRRRAAEKEIEAEELERGKRKKGQNHLEHVGGWQTSQPHHKHQGAGAAMKKGLEQPEARKRCEFVDKRVHHA